MIEYNPEKSDLLVLLGKRVRFLRHQKKCPKGILE